MQLNFSVIIATYNSEKWIGACLDSLVSQNVGFEKNIEIIIVDDCSSDNTKSVCLKWAAEYPDNIKFIEKDTHSGPGMTRNVGLKHARGKYVNFLDSDDYVSKKTFKEVLNFFENHPSVDLVSIPIFFFENESGPHYLNDKFEKTREIDLTENPENYHLSGPSSFIRRSSIKDIKFPDIITSEDVVFINEIMINNPHIGLCSEGRYYYRKRRENDSVINTSQLNSDYYIPRVENYFKYLIKKSAEKYGDVPQFIQNVIMYDIAWMLKARDVGEIIGPDAIEAFKTSLREVLENIDDELILNYKFLSKEEKANAFLLKYGNQSHPVFSRLKFNKIFIDIFDIVNDNLYVLANIPYLNDEFEVEVYVNGEKIEINKFFFPQRDMKYLDYAYCKDNSFEFNLPLSTDKNYKIEFKSKNKALKISFTRPCNFSKVVGYAKTKNYLSIWHGRSITIEHKTSVKWIKQEIKALIRMFKNQDPGYNVGIPFRIMYMLGYPFLRNKKIWFYMDRPEAADDNGMHLFRYVQDKDKDIKKYFVIKRDSNDYNEIKKIGPVLPFKSIKHRFLGMFVENIVTSHPDSEIIYPFWGTYPHIAGLLKSNNVFLQHGIIKDDISSWLNKFNMDLAFLATSSPLEYESVFQHPYHLEDVVKLTGLPRYDTLENNEDKKQIIIMPSWRRDLTAKSTDYIEKSEYFQRFNSLINNERLINACRDNGYEIIFRPHPKAYEFIELFDENDYVTIDYDKIKYQTLFNNGSLLITDYSSVAFDFSYLYKPVIYYQYSNDYHFDVNDSYFDYETMGLGEVIKTEDELVDLIIEYINNDCKIKEKYSKRIEEFFLYTDKNNCKRVYDEIKKIPLKD